MVTNILFGPFWIYWRTMSSSLLARPIGPNLAFALKVGALCVLACATAHAQQMHPVSVIPLSETAAVGEVSAVDRNSSGDLLVVDHIGNTVFTFGQDGQLISELDPRGCRIGYQFRPIYARFVQNEILVVNSDPWGLRFDRRGNCLGEMPSTFEAPASLAISEDGSLFGFYPWNATIIAYSHDSGRISSFATPNFRYPNAAARVEGGGIATVGKELFVAEPFAAEISVLDFDGRQLRAIDLSPLGLTVPAADLRQSIDMDSINEATEWLSRVSVILMLSEAAPGILLVQYRQPDMTLGIALFDTDGSLIRHYRGARYPIIYAGNGVALTVDQPEVDDRGVLPNPRFSMYLISR